eukprot:403371576
MDELFSKSLRNQEKFQMQDTIRLSPRDINPCRDPKCNQKNLPHQHQLKAYIQSLRSKSNQFDMQTKKMVITEQQLDSWYGIQASLDINNLPPYRPPGVNKIVYDNLKRYALIAKENEANSHNRTAVNKQHRQNSSQADRGSSMSSNMNNNQSNYKNLIGSKNNIARSSVRSNISNLRKNGGTGAQQQAINSLQTLSPRQLMDKFNLQLYPKSKKIETYIDTLPQYLSDEEQIMQNSTNNQLLRNLKRKQLLQSSSQVDNQPQLETQDVPEKRRFQVVRHENFKEHANPDKYTQNRMNSTINQLFSRTEIQNTVSKLKQIEKVVKIDSIIGTRKDLRQANSQPRKLAFINNDQNFVQKLEKQHQQIHSGLNSPKSPKIAAHLKRRLNLSLKLGEQQNAKVKDIPEVQNLDAKTPINVAYSLNQTLDFANENMSYLAQRNQKANHSVRNSIKKSFGVFRLLSPKTKLQEQRNFDYQNLTRSNNNYEDVRYDFHNQMLKKFNDSTRLNSESKQESQSSFRDHKETKDVVQYMQGIAAAKLNKEIMKNQIQNRGYNTQGYTTIQHSPNNSSYIGFLDKENKKQQVEQNDSKHISTEISSLKKHSRIATNTVQARKFQHIHSYHIENEEPESIQPDNRKMKMQVFKDSDYWLSKGYTMQQTEGIEVALDYYKHGIRVNRQDHSCVYNLACVYSNLNKNQNSRKWFNLCIKIAPQLADSYFGSAISSFKLKDYQEALNTLMRKPISTKSIFVTDDEFVYLKALCNKKLRNYSESENQYKSLDKQFRLSEGKKLIKYVFSIMILPLQTDKKLIEDYFDNFLELKNLHDPEIGLNQKVSQALDSIYVKNQWINNQDAVNFLQTFKFFKQLPKHVLIDLLPQLEIKTSKINDLVFVEDTVVLIINGRVTLRFHENHALDHKTLGVYSQGSILGSQNADNGLSCNSNSWLICTSKHVQYIQMSDKVYEKIIKLSLDTKKEINLLVYKNSSLFKGLFPCNQKRIVYEIGYLKKFEKGEILLTHHPRSPLNIDWLNYYRDINSGKLQKEIEKNLHEVDVVVHTGKIVSPSVYEGYMRALSKKKVNTQLLDEVKKQSAFSPQIKKLMLKNMTEGMQNVIKYNNIFGDVDAQRKALNSPQSFSSQSEIFTSMSPRGDEKIIKYIDKRPIMLIMSGKCKILNTFDDNKEIAQLKRGDIIGESDFLRLVSYDFFGEIVADSDEGVECLIINKPDKFISFEEKKKLVEIFKEKLDGIKYIVQTKYKLTHEDLHRY